MRTYRPAVWLFLLHSAIFNFGLLGIPDVITNFYLVSLGYAPEQIGVLLSLSRVAGLLTGLPVGWYAARLGERRILIIGAVGAAGSLLLMVVAPGIVTIGISRFLLGAFYGAGQIATAPLMVRLVEKQQVTQLFAVVNIVSSGAGAFGSLIGGYLPAWLTGTVPGSVEAENTQAYALALLVCALITLASIIPLYFIHLQADPLTIIQPRSSPRLLNTPWRTLVYLSIPMLLFGFTGGLTFPFYNLFFRDTFSISDDVVGRILSLGWLGMALIPMFNPYWERRFGRSLALGLLMSVGGIAFFMLAHSSALAPSIGFYVVGVSIRNCMQPLYQPLLLDSLPPSQHSMASSVSLVFWNIGWFAATAISGVWQTNYGFSFIFQIVSIGVLANGWLVFLIFRRRSRYTPVSMPQPEAVQP